MKILTNSLPAKKSITDYMAHNPPTGLCIIELDNRSDTRRIPSEIDKFIGTDLTSISLIMVKL
jgi:hypothetical protein